MKASEKAVLYQDLAKLTTAAFHLDRSLVLLLGQPAGHGRRAYLKGLQQGLQEGLGLADSIQKHNAQLATGLEISLIEAGERSGQLAEGFQHLANYFQAMETARKQARQAMIYPLVLLHLAILLPQLPAAITAPEGSSPWPRAFMAIGLLWVVLFLGGSLWRWLSEQAASSAALDAALNQIPLIGSARKHWALARFTQVFHAGLLAAFRISETVRLAGEASQSGQLRAGALAAEQGIEEGDTLSLALAGRAGFPPLFVQSLVIAEESGMLDQEMARWARLEKMEASAAVERAANWLPKIGYGLVVLFVVWQIFAMMQGYFGTLNQLLEGP